VVAIVSFAAALLVAAGPFACNSLVGLSDFEKGPCPGGVCDAGNDGLVSDAPTDVGDATADVPRGADPVSWARWRMPNWDAAVRLPNPPDFKIVDADVVQENLTGLVWRRNGDEARSKTYAEAIAFCAGLPGGWRLPKRIELVTLLDFGQDAGPPIDPGVFPNTKSLPYWTSSELRPFTPGKSDSPYWVVNFMTGAVEALSSASSNVASVRCVRAKA
jgi:hypothetical protein